MIKGAAFFARDFYNWIVEGDVVEIQLLGYVTGPDTPGLGRVVGAGDDDDGWERVVAAGGPHGSGARLVCDLLRQLAHV